MDLIRHIAIVSETAAVPLRDVTRVAAAVQKQVLRDFAPIWGIQATIGAFAAREDIPIGYWPILIQDDLDEPFDGMHRNRNGEPFGVVRAGYGWSITVSHEALEMLADPTCARLVSAPSPRRTHERVEFLLDICDPCQGVSYTVNGLQLCDFVTPNFYDAVESPGVRYSYTGAVETPRQVLSEGCCTWHEPSTGEWWQATNEDGELEFRLVEPRLPGNMDFRLADVATSIHGRGSHGFQRDDLRLRLIRSLADGAREAALARARLRRTSEETTGRG